MRNFNLRLFLISSLADALIASVCFFVLLRTLFTGSVLSTLANAGIDVFAFPMSILANLFSWEIDSFLLMYMMLLLNSLIFGLLVERIFSLIRKRRSPGK